MEAKRKDKKKRDVLSYINHENRYTKSVLKGTEKLQEKLFGNGVLIPIYPERVPCMLPMH